MIVKIEDDFMSDPLLQTWHLKDLYMWNTLFYNSTRVKPTKVAMLLLLWVMCKNISDSS